MELQYAHRFTYGNCSKAAIVDLDGRTESAAAGWTFRRGYCCDWLSLGKIVEASSSPRTAGSTRLISMGFKCAAFCCTNWQGTSSFWLLSEPQGMTSKFVILA